MASTDETERSLWRCASVAHRLEEDAATHSTGPGVWGLLALILFSLSAAGCGRSSNGPGDVTEKQLDRLGLWYGMYVSQSKGKPPKTADQVRNFGQERISAEDLSALGVKDVDELFVSPRDGQPYVMVQYARVPPPSPEPTVVFYEQTGQAGLRRVTLLGGGCLEFDAQRLQELVPGFKPP